AAMDRFISPPGIFFERSNFECGLNQRDHYARPRCGRLAVATDHHRSRIFRHAANSPDGCLTM
ncbi:MAG: hypothetical protein ABWY82_25130, partial [Tardiphaga sp.]